MSASVSGGHFVGFFLAVFGLAALIVAATRPALVQRLGSLRWSFVAGSTALLIVLAVFGSGSRQIIFRTVVGPSAGVFSRTTQAHVDAALNDVCQPEFVQYVARLDGSTAVQHPERLREALSVKAGTTVDLNEAGYRIEPPPKLGEAWLFVSYVERENAILAVLRGDEAVGRLMMVERLVSSVLPQAAAIAALRSATTDDEKMAILRENPFVLPYAAEWLSTELGKLEKEASPGLAREMSQKRAYVQKYVDDPIARERLQRTRIVQP